MVAQEAGLTSTRRVRRWTQYPDEDFEATVESERPPGITMIHQWNKLYEPEQTSTVV
jgi:hypothetical protein